jgi:hypothetical protein
VEVVWRGALTVLKRLFSRENLLALVLCLILILLIIVTTDSAPLWIYQGF